MFGIYDDEPGRPKRSQQGDESGRRKLRLAKKKRCESCVEEGFFQTFREILPVSDREDRWKVTVLRRRRINDFFAGDGRGPYSRGSSGAFVELY